MKLKIAVISTVALSIPFYLITNKNTEQTHKVVYQKNDLNDFPTTNLLKNGDIIFRRAYGVDSNIALNFSDGEKRYSHAGIIMKDNNITYVIKSPNKHLNHDIISVWKKEMQEH